MSEILKRLSVSILKDDDTKLLSLRVVIILIICYPLGAGILNIPFVISKLGFLYALIFLLINFCINMYSFFVLAELSDKLKKYDIVQVVSHYFDKKYNNIFKFLLICIYINVETLHLIFAWFFFDFLLLHQFKIDNQNNLKQEYLCRFIFCVVSFIIMFPLVIKKNIYSLRHFTYIFLALLIYCIFMFLFQGNSFKNKYIEENNFKTNYFGEESYYFIDYFSAFLFSFSCHSNVLITWGKMYKPTYSRLKKSIIYAITIELFIYGLFGFISYYFYGNRIKDVSILRDPLNMGDKDILIKIGIFTYGLGLIISNGFHATFLTNTIYEIFKFEDTQRNRILIGCIPIIISLITTFLYPNVLNVLSIGGGVFNNLTYYIIPFLVYYHAILKDSNRNLEKIIIIWIIFFLTFVMFSNFGIKFI